MAVFCAAQQQLSTLPQSAALVLIASTAVVDQVPGAAWSRWMVWRSVLARHGLPPDLEKALENARKHGILRAVGTSYHFQHAMVQSHLARATEIT